MRMWQDSNQNSAPTQRRDKLNRPDKVFLFCEKIENSLL